MMDPIVPKLEAETRRRRRRLMFRQSHVPVRMMIPNFFTLLGLSAGLTSIRMSIEMRWELALAAIVFAGLLDGLDGRVARLLKASSRFGAELDSLADFVNFGVAPAFLLFTWGLGDLKSLGWIPVMIFALASALRLARFNVASDDEKPRWQANYFVGVPTPAAAIILLLPVYLAGLGLDARDETWSRYAVMIYALGIAVSMVAVVPTFSGKLLGERVGREWVLPLFVAAISLVAMLLTFPYAVLAGLSLAYFISIPIAWRQFQRHRAAGEEGLPPRNSSRRRRSRGSKRSKQNDDSADGASDSKDAEVSNDAPEAAGGDVTSDEASTVERPGFGRVIGLRRNGDTDRSQD